MTHNQKTIYMYSTSMCTAHNTQTATSYIHIDRTYITYIYTAHIYIYIYRT